MSNSLTSEQRHSLCALLDTFLPSLDDKEVSKIFDELQLSSCPINRREAENVLRTSATNFGVADAFEEVLKKG